MNKQKRLCAITALIAGLTVGGGVHAADAPAAPAGPAPVTLSGAPVSDAPAAETGHCGPFYREIIQKIVCPTTGKVKNTRSCFDCKQEDFAYTRCRHTPVPSQDRPGGKHACGQAFLPPGFPDGRR